MGRKNRDKDGAGPAEAEVRQNLLPSADLAGELEQLQEQLREAGDRHLRALADFKNYRRHAERESHNLVKAGKREILLPLLVVVDDVERSLQWTSDEARPLADGVRLIHQELLALLAKEGVRPFDSVGRRFTHELHEAVGVAKSAGVAPGSIVDEVRRGYMWNDELLRPAQVRVAE